jgi:hypothetical protein
MLPPVTLKAPLKFAFETVPPVMVQDNGPDGVGGEEPNM